MAGISLVLLQRAWSALIVEIQSTLVTPVLNCTGIQIGEMISGLRRVMTWALRMKAPLQQLWLLPNLNSHSHHRWQCRTQVTVVVLVILQLMMVIVVHGYWIPAQLTIWRLLLRISPWLPYHDVPISPMLIVLPPLSLARALWPYPLRCSCIIFCLFHPYLISFSPWAKWPLIWISLC